MTAMIQWQILSSCRIVCLLENTDKNVSPTKTEDTSAAVKPNVNEETTNGEEKSDTELVSEKLQQLDVGGDVCKDVDNKQ